MRRIPQIPKKPINAIEISEFDMASKLILEHGLSTEKGLFQVKTCRILGSALQFSNAYFKICKESKQLEPAA